MGQALATVHLVVQKTKDGLFVGRQGNDKVNVSTGCWL
jgi:hypothetical protein